MERKNGSPLFFISPLLVIKVLKNRFSSRIILFLFLKSVDQLWQMPQNVYGSYINVAATPLIVYIHIHFTIFSLC